MILGRIIGRATTVHFQFSVSSVQARKFSFIQIEHADYGRVLGQIMELERTTDMMIAHCSVIGYKDVDGRVKGIRSPLTIGVEVLEAEDDFVRSIVEVSREGGYIGKLEGRDIGITLDLQKVLTKHLCVLAKSGAGKSYAVGVLLEEIMAKKVPLIIIDPHGEYSSMRFESSEKELLARWNLSAQGYGTQMQEYGDINSNPDLRPLKLDEKMTSYELMKLLPIQLSTTQEAMIFSVIKDLEEVTFDSIITGLENLNSPTKWNLIDTILYLRNLKLFSSSPTPLTELIRPGKCSIINLKGISPEVQDVIVYKLLKDLFLARKQEKVAPFFCVIEEAHNFCPEKGVGKAKSAEIVRLISSEGRKFGLGLCVVTQRPALVSKTVLSQCSTQLIMKVTNPNDLKAIGGSLEGITTETEDEIQNLAVGSALLCGMVDRPLIVSIRPRKSKHGGHAVDMLALDGEEEYAKDVVVESKAFEEQGMLLVVKPKLSLKDIELMSSVPLRSVTTYLIPAGFFDVELGGMRVALLLDRVKGKVILDPDTDQKCELREVGTFCNFLRKPVYEKVDFHVKIDEQITLDMLKSKVATKGEVVNARECFIVYQKVEY